MARLAAALVLLCALLSRGWAHDPIFIDAVVSAEDGTVSVVVQLRQATALAGIGELRSRFDDRADYVAAERRLAIWLLQHVALTADGQPVALGYDGPPAEPAELADPLPLRLSGALPRGTHALGLTLTLFENLGGAMSIIDNVSLAGHEAQSATVKPGETVTLLLEGGGQTSGFATFLRLGFLHIVPEGLDHILFVLGLFLLSPRLKPLLTQVTAFSVAHSLTLGLSLAGVIALPARVVEPLIAASIAVVAIENLFTREVRSWRWMVVFGFGLVHGLGFASALKDLRAPGSGLVQPLVGFNLGVELGQLTVLAVAAAATWWAWKRAWYRRAIVVPASLAIAAAGTFWAVQRALGHGLGP